LTPKGVVFSFVFLHNASHTVAKAGAMVGNLKRIRETQLIPVAQQNKEFETAAVHKSYWIGCTAAAGKSGRLSTTTMMQGNGQL